MRSLVDEVKERLDIVEVISGYVKLTSAGTNMRGLCPFHREKTPSFMVSKEKQIFHCFGCGKGGDVITFTQEIESMEFKEALKLLAERAGLDYRKWQGVGTSIETSDKKETIRRVLEFTAAYYQKCLDTPEGSEASKYLKDRGLNKTSIQNFRLGYAPRSNKNGYPSALYDHLKEAGFSVEAILASGSVYKKDNQNVFVDRFRERIIFPIGDSLGRIVGFSARLLPGSESFQGKYINTPGTLLYDKGGLFYGFHLAKQGIREAGEAIMLEGNLDVILSHQSGIKQSIATCGTALGKKQLSMLKRYTQRVVLAFDADMAGVKATKRAAELAWEEELEVKVIPIKIGKDVADIVLEDSERWKKMVASKKSVANYFFNLAFKNRKLTLDQKNALAERILKLLQKNPSRVEQSHYVRKLAEEVRVPEEYFWEKIRKNQKNYNPNTKREAESEVKTRDQKKDRRFLLEERFIGLLYNYPKLYFKHRERVKNLVFSADETESMFKKLIQFFDSCKREKKEKISSEDIKLDSRDLQLRMSEIAFTIEKDLGDDSDENWEKAQSEILICLNYLEKEYLKSQRPQILSDIKEAQKKGDKEQIEILMKRLQEVSREIAK